MSRSALIEDIINPRDDNNAIATNPAIVPRQESLYVNSPAEEVRYRGSAANAAGARADQMRQEKEATQSFLGRGLNRRTSVPECPFQAAEKVFRSTLPA
jgi:hypothetical protein